MKIDLDLPIDIGSKIKVNNKGFCEEQFGEYSIGTINSIKIYLNKDGSKTVCFSVKIHNGNEIYRLEDIGKNIELIK